MNAKTSHPKAIFFDLDETLIENKIPIRELFASLYADFSDRLDAELREGFFTDLTPRLGQLWQTMFDTHTSPEQLLCDAFAQSAESTANLSAAQATQLGEDMFARFKEKSAANAALHPGATDTLAALSSAGFQTGIITNGIEQVQLGKVHAVALEHAVDHVVVSAQARAHKPDQKVFSLALERAAVAPHEAWQVGDHATNDVAGAIRFGMSGVFFDPHGRREHAFNDLEVTPSHTVDRLTQVLELLEITSQ